MRTGPVWVLACAFLAQGQVPSEVEQAIALEQNGKTEQAIVLLQGFLRRDPKSAEAHNWLGVAYLQKNSARPSG
jgi:Flp pilus assembly protein TadD